MWKLLDAQIHRREDVGDGSRSGAGGGAWVQASARWRREARAPAPGQAGREGRAAATGGGCVRIADHELRALQPLAIVDLRAAQVLHAHRIDEQLHAEVLDAGVAVLDLLIELEAVLQARATPALHEDPQHELGITLATDQIPDLAGRGVGEQQRRCFLQRFGRAHSLHTCDGSLEGDRGQVKAALHTPEITPPPGPVAGAVVGASGSRRTSFPMIWAPSVISMTP